MSMSTTRVIKHTVAAAETATACEILATRSGFSKGKIKDAMNKGAVWLIAPTGPMKRLRRATATLNAGEKIELHYNDEVLAKDVPASALVADLHHYSIWFKPSGVLAQGTMEGDHCALLRQVELYFKMLRPVFLVHRLDREASGLMLVAHSQNAAAGKPVNRRIKPSNSPPSATATNARRIKRSSSSQPGKPKRRLATAASETGCASIILPSTPA